MTIEQLKSNIKWWESKRWIYNLLVGLCGVFGIFSGLAESPFGWEWHHTFAIIIWVIGANIFYSLGTLVELFDWYYLNSKMGLVKIRWILFIGGTVFSCIHTILNLAIFGINKH